MQETTVVALKNCAASSQEAAFLIANMDPALEQLKALALRDVHSRISDVVSRKHPCLPACCLFLAPRRHLNAVRAVSTTTRAKLCAQRACAWAGALGRVD